jgi:predicted RNA-binding Zn-ribbon protein involved in translation (DUF1610 family)
VGLLGLALIVLFLSDSVIKVGRKPIQNDMIHRCPKCGEVMNLYHDVALEENYYGCSSCHVLIKTYSEQVTHTR